MAGRDEPSDDDEVELPSRSEFMAGRCYDMAVALHQVTGLPMHGLFGDGGCHHAFVWDEGRGIGIDARGVSGLDLLRRGCRGQEARPMDTEDIEECVGRTLAAEEIDEAHAFIEQDDILSMEVLAYEKEPDADAGAASPKFP